MTGLPGLNFAAFNEAASFLEAMGYEVENPAEKGVIDGWSWEEYLRYDLRMLLDCDAIVMLPGWTKSPGARLEHHVASKLGFKVVYWDKEEPACE